jgi:hypothetical protein
MDYTAKSTFIDIDLIYTKVQGGRGYMDQINVAKKMGL